MALSQLFIVTGHSMIGNDQSVLGLSGHSSCILKEVLEPLSDPFVCGVINVVLRNDAWTRVGRFDASYATDYFHCAASREDLEYVIPKIPLLQISEMRNRSASVARAEVFPP